MTTVTLLYFEDCPSWQTADERLRRLQDDLGFDLERRIVDTPDEVERLAFRGSPTTAQLREAVTGVD